MTTGLVAGSTRANMAELLKETYGDVINRQFYDEVTTYNQFKTADRKPSGLGYNFNATYANPQGSGARADGALLPSPLPGKYDKGRINPVYNYARLRMSGPAIAAAKDNMSAFMVDLGGEIENLYNGLVVDLNRQCHSDGFGALATLSAASDSLSTTATWTATCDNDTGLMNLQEGMVIDFYNTAGAIDQSATSSRILSLNPVTKVVTFEANDGTYKADHPIVAARSYTIATDTVPSGSVIVRQGAREAAFATSDTPIEITGLQGIYDDGTLLSTFENIVVADNPRWKANILSNSGVNRELTVNLMLQALDRTRIASGMKASMMRMGLGQKRKYSELLSPDVRFAPTELRGGYEVLTFSGGDGTVEMLIDPVQAPNRVYFEVKDAIKKYELEPLGWGDFNGTIQQRQDYDQGDQFLRIYANLGVEKRSCLTLLKDLTEPSLY